MVINGVRKRPVIFVFKEVEEMPITKKFLDADGVSYLASLLDNYPDNEILGTVISAIQDALSEKNNDLGLSIDAQGYIC